VTNLEIDHRLARAIGYAPEDLMVSYGVLTVRPNSCGWYRFDHQDPGTIYPIAEKYKRFPRWSFNRNEWGIFVAKFGWVWASCPRTCVAIAVIEASERGLL
jgi:hypothetical protein